MTSICRKSTQRTWVNCIGPILLLANYVANTVNAVATNVSEKSVLRVEVLFAFFLGCSSGPCVSEDTALKAAYSMCP